MPFEPHMDPPGLPPADQDMPEQSPSLALDELSRWLAQANGLKEIVDLRDLAKAAQRVLQRDPLNAKTRNEASELVLRADRKAGKLLASFHARDGNNKSNAYGSLNAPGLNVDQSSAARWQRVAAVPDAEFERYLAEAKASGNKLSAAGLLRFAAQASPPEGPLTEKRVRGKNTYRRDRAAAGASALRAARIEILGRVEKQINSLERILNLPGAGDAHGLESPAAASRPTDREFLELKELLAAFKRLA